MSDKTMSQRLLAWTENWGSIDVFSQFFRVEENCTPKLHFVVVKIGAERWAPGVSVNLSNIQGLVNYPLSHDRTDPVAKETK